MGFKIGSSLTHSLGSIAGAAIGGAIGGPAGAYVGANAGSLIGPSQERMDKRNYNYQLKKSRQAWDLQNAYNSPVQQMQRLKEAGLNPMLVYGSGNVTGNAASSIDMPTLGSSDVMSGANQITGLAGELSSNSFKQNMQEQRIAAQQGLQNNELDIQLKQARLEYLRKVIEGKTGPHGNVTKPEKPLTFSQQRQINKIVGQINSDGKLDMNKEYNRINPGAYIFNWAIDHLGKHYADKVWDIKQSYYNALDKRSRSGKYMLP